MSEQTAEQETPAVPLTHLRPALEAVLMVADEPLDPAVLATAVGQPVREVVSALEALAAEYTEDERGFEVRNVAGGWRFYARDEYADVVSGFVLEGQQARLTQAALETLAVVAYKQPVSRARVSAIRGVNVDGVMRTLLNRGLVEEAGQDTETGANLYITTSYFLERIGIVSLDELPELAPYLPDLDDLEDELESVAGSDDAGALGGGDEPPAEVATAPVVPDAEPAGALAGVPTDEDAEADDHRAELATEPDEPAWESRDPAVDDRPADEESDSREPEEIESASVSDESYEEVPEPGDEADPEPGAESGPETPVETEPTDEEPTVFADSGPDVRTVLPSIDLDHLPPPDEGPVEGRLKDQFPGLFR